jgi:hypothetical protein
MTFRRIIFVLVVLVSTVLVRTARSQGQSTVRYRSDMDFKIETDQSIYRAEEKIAITYRISNVGADPVYVNQEIRLLNGWDAGVRINVYDAQDNKVAGSIMGHLPIPDYDKEDVVKYIREKWILMFPGSFYGMRTFYFSGCRLAPGRYKIVATYFSNILDKLTSAQVASLDKLGHPFLAGDLTSNEVRVEVKADQDIRGPETCPITKSQDAK